MPIFVTMPGLGSTVSAGTIINWLAAEGNTVSAGMPIVTVAAFNEVDAIAAPASGVLRKILAEAGTAVPVMGEIAVITAPDEIVSDEELAVLRGAIGSPLAAPGAPRQRRVARIASRDAAGRINASPAARKLATQLNVPLASAVATGPGGRLTRVDVERAAYARARAAAAPARETVRLANGRSLGLLVAGPRNANPALVFLHRPGASLSTWDAVMPAFANRYRVAAFDLPGHGGTDGTDPASADYSLAGLARAVGEAIASAGLAPAVIIGHSLGGAVALRIALDRPKLVRALVLINSARLGPETSAADLDRVDAPPGKAITRSLLHLCFADKHPVLERDVDEMYRNQTSPGGDAALNEIAAQAFTRPGQQIDPRSRLQELRHPVHLIWGERAQVVPLHQAWGASAVLRYSWLDVITGAGYLPHVEAPAATIAAIEDFLRHLPSVPPWRGTVQGGQIAKVSATAPGPDPASPA